MADEEGQLIEKQNDVIIEGHINIEKLLSILNKNIDSAFETIQAQLKTERDELEKVNKELREYYDKRDKNNQVYMK